MEQPTPYFATAEGPQVPQPPVPEPPRKSGKSRPRRAPRTRRHSVQTRRTLKYLGVCQSPDLARRVFASSSDRVIKTLCNMALNLLQGDVGISSQVKRRLAPNRNAIQALANPALSLGHKRKLLSSKGQTGRGLLGVIPLLISTVLSSVGSRIFDTN